MAENSKIEWTDHTFNPWIGCQKVSPGCDHCYAEVMMDHRYGRVQWGPHGERKRTSAANWKLPLRWAKQANGRRPRVFCASLADVFDNQVPMQWREDLWQLIAATPELDWLLLTKRPENIIKMLPPGRLGIPWPWPNVWLGTTIEDRARGANRAYHLACVPAVIRFWSCEPLLEDLGDLTPLCLFDMAPDGRNAVEWVICGGESGPHARPMHPDWARSIRDQCAGAHVAFFMKQMMKKQPIPPDLMVRQFPRAA